ncbi:MAG: hypothetical protein ACLPKW_19055 [Acetobacteraceae bacterium]|jgi:hypothetical protein
MSKTAGVSAILLGAAMLANVAWAQSDLATSMPQSKTCSAQDGGWSAPGGTPGIGSITMSNDGGQRLAVEFNDVVFGGAMHLSKLPKHGQVAIVQHRDYTEVAYKPDANYKGADSFSVLVQINNINKPYNVTVE